jgi:uncharacterized membrane protein (DUF2068 family)
VVTAGAAHDRLLPWIAAERSLRAVALVVVGVVLVSHPGTDWSRTVLNEARRAGFDPSHHAILARIIRDLARVSPRKFEVFGGAAIAYGVIEGVEGYGLWRRRRWGEWLTVIATSLLFIPEIWELTKRPTPLKAAALVVNVAIVAYLISRLRRRREPLNRG